MDLDGCIDTDQTINYLEHVQAKITLMYSRRYLQLTYLFYYRNSKKHRPSLVCVQNINCIFFLWMNCYILVAVALLDLWYLFSRMPSVSLEFHILIIPRYIKPTLLR